jgi:hypothetical protein
MMDQVHIDIVVYIWMNWLNRKQTFDQFDRHMPNEYVLVHCNSMVEQWEIFQQMYSYLNICYHVNSNEIRVDDEGLSFAMKDYFVDFLQIRNQNNHKLIKSNRK